MDKNNTMGAQMWEAEKPAAQNNTNVAADFDDIEDLEEMGDQSMPDQTSGNPEYWQNDPKLQGRPKHQEINQPIQRAEEPEEIEATTNTQSNKSYKELQEEQRQQQRNALKDAQSDFIDVPEVPVDNSS